MLDRAAAKEETRPRRSIPVGSAIAFFSVAGLVLACALPGGSYDLVIRQAAGLAVWWVLALGFALGLLPRSRLRPIAWLPAIALAALGAWTLLSLAWSQSDERTLAEAARIVSYLGVLVLAVCALDRRTWRAAAAGLVAGALVVAALSTASRLVPGPFPADPVRGFSNLRLNYPFDYWNAVGAWGAMAVTGALALSVSASRVAFRAAFLALIPVAGLSIYLSYSRAAIAGIVAGVVCVLALSSRRLLVAAHLGAAGAATGLAIAVVRGQPSLAHGGDAAGAGWVLIVLLGGGLACAAAAAATWRVGADRWRLPLRTARLGLGVAGTCLLLAAVVAGPALASRAWDSFRQEDAPATLPTDPAERLGNLQGSRYSVWSETVDAFRAHPGRGSGAGTFEFAWNRAGRSPEFFRDAHSIYLEPLAELGWPGALLTLAFLACLAGVAVEALRRGRRATTRGAAVAMVAMLAVFLVQAGVDWMWELTAVAVLALAAAAIASVRLSDPAEGPVITPAARAGAAAASTALCLLLLPGLVSASLVRDSRASAAAGDLDRAAAQADDAVGVAPWAVTPLLQRGLVSERAGDLGAARRDMRRAAELEPDNWRPPFLLARVEGKLGRPRAARLALRRARRLRPRAVVFQRPAPE